MPQAGRSLSNWQLPDQSDLRLESGYRRQRSALDQRLAQRERLIGYKVGVNDPASQKRLGITGPIHGYLTSASLIDATKPVRLGGTVVPGVEVELAMTIDSRIDPRWTIDDIGRAIGSIRLAAELIDIDDRYDDLEGVLAGNAFHRALALGETTCAFASAEVMQTSLHASRNDRQLWNIPIGFVLGDPREAARFIGRSLAARGQELLQGDIVISGLLLPLPIWVKPGDRVHVAAGMLGDMTMQFVE